MGATFNFMKIQLGGRNKDKFILVDKNDYHLVSSYKWFLSSDGRPYAIVAMGAPVRLHKKCITIGRTILNPPDHLEVDHINRDPLDNRRHNLRLCTRVQNEMNKGPRKNKLSRFKGVSLNRQINKWYAHIKFEKRSIYLGSYSSEEEAASAYNNEAKRLYGEFAWLNPV